MFQIIYRRIYLLYVLVDSFSNAKVPPIHSRTVFVTFGLFLSVTASSTLGFPSESCRGGGGGASWHCYRKKKHEYDATLLSFKSDKYTVADHQKRGRERYGVADKLL